MLRMNKNESYARTTQTTSRDRHKTSTTGPTAAFVRAASINGRSKSPSSVLTHDCNNMQFWHGSTRYTKQDLSDHHTVNQGICSNLTSRLPDQQLSTRYVVSPTGGHAGSIFQVLKVLQRLSPWSTKQCSTC